MENSQSGGTPPNVSATPAAAQPAASSSTVQDTLKEQAQAVRSPLDLRKAIEAMKAVTKPGAQPQPAVQPQAQPAPVEATPVAEAAPEAAPASEETPAVEATPEQATEVATPPADQPHDGDDEEGGEGPILPLTGKRAHLRVPDSEVDRLALAYQKRNRDWTLEQSLEAAKKHLGIKPETPAAPTEGTPNAPAQSSLPATTEATAAAITQALADYKKAMAEVRFEDAADLQAKILELRDHRFTLERRAEQAEVQKAKEYDVAFDASNAKAVELYPFAADEAHPGNKRMQEIDAQLKQLNDPLFYSPNKPLKLAQMVAAELNIAPKSKAQPAKPAAAPAAPAAPQPKKGVVPSGNSRTVPPPTNQPAVDPAITNIKSVRDLREQYKRLGIPM